MKHLILKSIIGAIILTAIVRGIIELSQPFSRHVKEVFDFPGLIIRGVVAALLTDDVTDGNQFTQGLDVTVNFVWLFILVLLILLLIFRVRPRQDTASSSNPIA